MISLNMYVVFICIQTFIVCIAAIEIANVLQETIFLLDVAGNI